MLIQDEASPPEARVTRAPHYRLSAESGVLKVERLDSAGAGTAHGVAASSVSEGGLRARFRAMDPYRKFRVLVSPLLSALGCTALVLYLGEGQLPVSLGFSAIVAASYAAALIYLQRRLRALEPDLSHAG